MQITMAELEARLRAARDQEDILLRALAGRETVIPLEEMPARIDMLGSGYQGIIIGMGQLLELRSRDRGGAS